MRPIKFRAWDKFNEEMYYSINSLSKFFQIVEAAIGGGNEVQLMQFTGLLDKNGVEIYEGDIVQIHHPFKNRLHVGKIIYNAPRFELEGFYFTHQDDPSDFKESLEYVEIIGNIYESPELSNQSK